MTYPTVLPKPRNEQDFEDLCRDLFAALWGGAELYGRRFQNQHGIDVCGRTDEGRVAVQCKNHMGGLKTSVIDADVAKARGLEPPLKRLIFATTAARDTHVQDHVDGILAGDSKLGFAIELWFWEDICRKLDDDEGLRARWATRLLGEEEPPLVDVGRLPSTILPKLIGREDELALLEDAWNDPKVRVQSVVAVGGAGKTALVHHWMQGFEDAGWKERGVAAAYAWSFYSQGGADSRQASGDQFIDESLRFFGEKDPPKSARDRGLRLAKLVRQRRTLMILDGLEPLQHPPASVQAGRVKDPAVAALIGALAADNPGLLVITTREPVAELKSRDGRGARSHDLEHLSAVAGVDLLRWLEVRGKEEDLEDVVKEVHGHAFTLTLIGTFLRDAHASDVRAWKDVHLLDAAALIDNAQASKVMAAYGDWFCDGPERQLLAVLGLFDRPADAAAVEALCKAPEIAGLTDRLAGLRTARRKVALKRLRRARLLLEPEASATADGALDAHPLVREHFGLVLKREAPAAYRAGNQRLYEHYVEIADDLPDTLEAMLPLYLAIGSGCRAGRRQEVFDEVYVRRVLRGNEDYAVKKLGAVGSDLTALASFFEDPWDRPDADLRSDRRALLLNQAGYYLSALGRLADAVEPLQASLEMWQTLQNWKESAVSAVNLSELLPIVGDVDRGVEVAQMAVGLADRSEDPFLRLSIRTVLASILHMAGEFGDAESMFREAEAMQLGWQPRNPKLYAVAGYRYCDMLLNSSAPLDGSAKGKDALVFASEDALHGCTEVRERALYALEISERNNQLLSIGLDHLSLGRASLGLALAKAGDLEDAVAPLDAAVLGLRAAAVELHLPRGLIARATLYRFRDDVPAAEADLEEALDIAERGSMRLHECDAHLEWARLRHSVDDFAGARQHLDVARALVASTGYRRCDREVAELTQTLAELEQA